MAQDPVQLIAQAKRAYSNAHVPWFKSWIKPDSWSRSKTDYLEDAAELYVRAAAAYRANRAMREAGVAYEKAAKIQGTDLNEPDDMANTLQEAFKVYREDYPEDAARCLSQAINHYVYKGSYRRAAGQKKILAEMYEQNMDRINARSAYSEAALWFEDDNAPANANRLNSKAAEFAAWEGDYLDAIQRFEHVARLNVKANKDGGKLSVKDYLLNAGTCHLALDIVGAKRALENYPEIESDFPSTNEGRLFADLTEIVEQGDSEAFVDRLVQFKRKSAKFPQWQDIVFGRINDQLKEKEEDFS